MDKDIKSINIKKSNHGFIVELNYTNDKYASFSVDGFDLQYVFQAIHRQNDEVHRGKLWGPKELKEYGWLSSTSLKT